MKKEWISIKEKLPKSGQEVLIYYYDHVSEKHTIDILQYFRKGDAMYKKIDRDPSKTKTARLLNTMFGKDLDVIADKDGFYVFEWDAKGDTVCRKHSDIITHWQELPEPPTKQVIN